MGTMQTGNTAWKDHGNGTVSLIASQCKRCNQVNFPPLVRCPSCWNQDAAVKELYGPGTLYSFSIVHLRKRGLPVPYVAGYVDFPEGIRAFGIIDIHPSQAAIDLQLKPGMFRILDEDGKVLEDRYCFKVIKEEE